MLSCSLQYPGTGGKDPKIQSRKENIPLTGASQIMDVDGDTMKTSMRNKAV